MTTGQGEDEAWRAIVDNYGERARLDDEPFVAAPTPPPAAPPTPAAVADAEPEERFVPPGPPPAPRRPLPVLGSPAFLLVALLVSFDVPALLGYALVSAFVGSFVYLVATMQRADERNPWDDGAQI